jgi:regulator of protease activity HflC (stomatin/prohibitin superfamily)
MRDVVLGLLVLALATLCIVQRFQYQKMIRTVEQMSVEQAELAHTLDALKAQLAEKKTEALPPKAKSDADAVLADAPTGDGNSETIMRAQDQYVHGQYAQAIETAKRALPSSPSKAWRVIGAANCFLKNRSGAREAWSKLAASERSFLVYVCTRNHVTLP